jgi:hypothetical protein
MNETEVCVVPLVQGMAEIPPNPKINDSNIELPHETTKEEFAIPIDDTDGLTLFRPDAARVFPNSQIQSKYDTKEEESTVIAADYDDEMDQYTVALTPQTDDPKTTAFTFRSVFLGIIWGMFLAGK